MDLVTAHHRSTGKLDPGIVTLSGTSCEVVGETAIYTDPSGTGSLMHYHIKMDRGVSFEAALECREEAIQVLQEQEPWRKPASHYSGFYIQQDHSVMAGGQRRHFIMLATEITRAHNNTKNVMLRLQRPNVGPCGREKILEVRSKGYVMAKDDAKAQALWDFWHTYTKERCYHGDNCKQARETGHCGAGGRLTSVHLLAGAVLPHLARIEMLHRDCPVERVGRQMSMRIVKCSTSDGTSLLRAFIRYVGLQGGLDGFCGID
jgi:hypothetical protein